IFATANLGITVQGSVRIVRARGRVSSSLPQSHPQNSSLEMSLPVHHCPERQRKGYLSWAASKEKRWQFGVGKSGRAAAASDGQYQNLARQGRITRLYCSISRPRN